MTRSDSLKLAYCLRIDKDIDELLTQLESIQEKFEELLTQAELPGADEAESLTFC